MFARLFRQQEPAKLDGRLGRVDFLKSSVARHGNSLQTWILNDFEVK